MELDKIKEIIENARAAAKNEEFRQLVDRFEAFILLYDQKEKAQEDPNFRMKLDDSCRQFWNAFEKVSASFGLTPDAFKAFFENPANFSPQQWSQMQTIKQQFTAEKIAPSSPKKLRKTHKKLRI